MSNSAVALLEHWSIQKHSINQSVHFISCQEIIHSLCGISNHTIQWGTSLSSEGLQPVHKFRPQASQSSGFIFGGFFKAVSSVALSVSRNVIAVSSEAVSKKSSSIGSCLFLKSSAQRVSTLAGFVFDAPVRCPFWHMTLAFMTLAHLNDIFVSHVGKVGDIGHSFMLENR